MSYPDNVPRTCNDLERMLVTSSHFSDSTIRLTTLVPHGDPHPKGCVYERRLRVHPHPYNDTVVVEEVDAVVTKEYDDHSWAARYLQKWSKEMSFNQFRESEFWDETLEAFKNGDADASAFEQFHAHCDGAQGVVSMEIEKQYRDALGNARVAKEHSRFECLIDMAGWLTMSCGTRLYDGDARELFDLIDEALAFRAAGISIKDNTLSVPINMPDEQE